MPNIFYLLQIGARLDIYTDKGLAADLVLQEIYLFVHRLNLVKPNQNNRFILLYLIFLCESRFISIER